MLRWMLAGPAARPRMHRAAAPGRADRLPGVRRARRPRRSAARWRWARRLRLPDLPRAGGGARPRRRPRAVPRVPPRNLARRPVRPAGHAVRADLHPGRHPDRARASATRWACSSTARDACSLAYFGDGSASEGDFHEAREPRGRVRARRVILFCQNNGWAISVPTREPDRRGDLAARRGLRVPGRPGRRQRRARRVPRPRGRPSSARCAGDGPTLIEALTYRIGAHSTADDAGPLPRRCRGRGARERSIRSRGSARGCVAAGPRGRRTRSARGAEEIEAQVLAIREGVVAQPAPPVEWMFDWTYADPPRRSCGQRAEALGG